MRPTRVLLSRGPAGRAQNRGPQMRTEQRSVPSKDKRRCGLALWEWPLMAQTWEVVHEEWQASAGSREGG